MIIDAHTHIDQAGGKVWTPQDLITSMDEARIDLSLLISNGDAPVDKMLEYAAAQPRFKVIGHVDFAAFNQSQLEKLKEHLVKKEILGVKLYPGYEDFYPYDAKLEPLFKFCQENGFPIVIHTGIMLSGRPGFMEQTHPLGVDRIAAKFPNLKIIIAHFGNPWVMDAAAVVAKNPHVYTDFSGYFAEFKDISEIETQMFIRQLTDFKIFVGSFKKCLFGTDFPLYNQRQYLDAVMKLPMTDEEKELVLWKNANDVYNLGIT